jgi:hypothetical protein
VALRGRYDFDAVSPDGASVYLAEIRDSARAYQYILRRYDLRAGRFDAQPVVEKGSNTARMVGTAIARASSDDGAWVYTLYVTPSATVYVHALAASSSNFSLCYDLPGSVRTPGAAGRAWSMTLGGSQIALANRVTGDVGLLRAEDPSVPLVHATLDTAPRRIALTSAGEVLALTDDGVVSLSPQSLALERTLAAGPADDIAAGSGGVYILGGGTLRWIDPASGAPLGAQTVPSGTTGIEAVA